MKQTTYKIQESSPQGLKTLSKEDSRVVDSFEINNVFNPKRDKVEYHIYSLDGELLTSEYNYINESFLQGSNTAGTEGASVITIDVIKDVKESGYPYGGINVVYNFTTDLYTPGKNPVDFYITEISEDRKEIRLLTNKLTDKDLISITSNIKESLDKSSYLNDFRVNLKDNNLLTGVNIDTQSYKENQSVIVKLYEPLPELYDIKSILTIEQIVNDTVSYEIEVETFQDDIVIPKLKGPNFSVDLSTDTSVVPSGFFSYNDLFTYPTENNFRELNSIFAEKGVNISIDYSDFSEFTHFSSVSERLRNFKYKLELIDSLQNSFNERNISSNTFSTGSIEHYKSQINSILTNFDHYDRHLYYESGSTSWPKIPGTKPYENYSSSHISSSTWYTNELNKATLYDNSNYNQLLNTVPTYLREDSENAPYELFIHMVAQHFDNIWIYTKAVTDKYDNDNRVNSGISRDLVEDALKNFGVKLYTSNNSLESLFKTFTGEFYATGSEQINTFVTASNVPTSEDQYRKEVYKRLYHNLPLLLKGKGTERGLRALLNSFGIPTSYTSGSQQGLSIKTTGGTNTESNYNLGPELITTSSLSKIRIDNTGSIVEGNTLSIDTSIVKRNKSYTDDLHSIEVGYSPTDVINEKLTLILSSSNFNIDQYIGDPDQFNSNTYSELVKEANSRLIPLMVSGSHNLQDFTRILKFYDNVIFKTVKDFLPGRSNVSTGVIIKPHLLERNKLKQVQGIFSTSLITGEDKECPILRIKNPDSGSIIKVNYIPCGEVNQTSILLESSSLGALVCTNLSSVKSTSPFEVEDTGKKSRPNKAIAIGEYSGSHGKVYGLNTSYSTAKKVGSVDEMISSSLLPGQVVIITGSNSAFIKNKKTSSTYEDFSQVKLPVDSEHTTNYSTEYMTSGGLVTKGDHLLEQAKYNGELSGSQITVSQTDLDPINPFKYAYNTDIKYKLKFELFEEEPETPTPTPTGTPTPTPTGTPTPTPTIQVTTDTPTPTPSPATCYTYEISNDGDPLEDDSYTYLRCDGTTISGVVYFGDSITVCGQSFSHIGASLTVTNTLVNCSGGSTQTPTPTPVTYYLFDACDGGQTIAAAISTPLDANLRYVDYSSSPVRYFTYTGNSNVGAVGYLINNNPQPIGNTTYGCP